MTLLERIFPAKTIAGCRDPKPLMTRRRILTTPWFAIKLHNFHRSDEDREVHDHPWLFISIILRGGYVEVRPRSWCRDALRQCFENAIRPPFIIREQDLERAHCLPGSILFRPPWWAHRVELLEDESWSLVIVFPKVRDWGFYTLKGWMPWRRFHGQAGCGDDTVPTYRRG